MHRSSSSPRRRCGGPEVVEDSAPRPAEDAAEPEEKRSTFEIAVERMSGRSGRRPTRSGCRRSRTPATLDQLMPDLAVDPGLGLVSPRWRGAGSLTDPARHRRRAARAAPREPRGLLGGARVTWSSSAAPLSGKSTLVRTARRRARRSPTHRTRCSSTSRLRRRHLRRPARSARTSQVSRPARNPTSCAA